MGEPGEVELVGVALAVDLSHNVLVVVVAQRTTQLVVVHVGLRLALPPAACHLVRVDQLKLALRALPGDAGGVGGVGEELQEELPQLDLSGACRRWKGQEGYSPSARHEIRQAERSAQILLRQNIS